MSKQVFTRNTVSGQVGYVPASYLDHPVLGKTLEQVDEGTKPFHPDFHAETDKDGKDSTGKQIRKPKDRRTETEKIADHDAAQSRVDAGLPQLPGDEEKLQDS
jgi:hypothetical protein